MADISNQKIPTITDIDPLLLSKLYIVDEENDISDFILKSVETSLKLSNVNSLYSSLKLLEMLKGRHDPRFIELTLDIHRFEKKRQRILKLVTTLNSLLAEFQMQQSDVRVISRILEKNVRETK